MGNYTTLTFEGIVKEKYRLLIDEFMNYKFDDCNNRWSQMGYDVPCFDEYGKDERADFIPFGSKPEERSFDRNTGLWKFKCELKNYNHTIEKFGELIVPEIIETVLTFISDYRDNSFVDVFHYENGKFTSMQISKASNKCWEER